MTNRWKAVLALVLVPALLYAQGLPIKSGASGSLATVDAASLAMRTSPYDTRGNAIGEKRSYSAATTLKTATAAGTTPFFSICGSATTVVKVQKISMDYVVATAGVHADPRLQKTSTATSGGTATALVQVPHDSNSAAASVGLVNYYTALATSGTVVGTIDIQMRWAQITATVTGGSQITRSFLWERTSETEAIVLRGTAQCLQGSFGTTTTNAPTMTVAVTWTEE
jgi:hypothetical protein